MSKATWRYFDWVLLLVVVALIVLGEAMIYSGYEAAFAGSHTLWENTVFRQGVFAVAGIVVFFIMAAIDYRLWQIMYRWIYIAILLMLGLTLAFGETSFGATSWLPGELFGIQPSELCKILVILVTAKLLGLEKEELESPLPFILSAAAILPPAALIYAQSDFGTALMVMATWAGMVFLSGVRWRHVLILPIVGTVAAPVIWFRMKDYMRDRVLMFLIPGYDPSGASYNITQALISIGSGGWWGKGYRQGTQSQLLFLRVRHTDFIFSVLAEEFGFVGAILTLALFAILILRLLRIARLARDNYGQLVVAGVVTMILVQTVINLGMNANLLPVTGLPLPLVSYGGSSLMSTLIALGLAQSVILRHKEPDNVLL